MNFLIGLLIIIAFWWFLFRARKKRAINVFADLRSRYFNGIILVKGAEYGSFHLFVQPIVLKIYDLYFYHPEKGNPVLVAVDKGTMNIIYAGEFASSVHLDKSNLMVGYTDTTPSFVVPAHYACTYEQLVASARDTLESTWLDFSKKFKKEVGTLEG